MLQVKLDNVLKEMDSKIDILGWTEVRWADVGDIVWWIQNYLLLKAIIANEKLVLY